MFIELDLARCMLAAALLMSTYNFLMHSKSLTDLIPMVWVQKALTGADYLYGPYEIGIVATSVVIYFVGLFLVMLPLRKTGYLPKLLGCAVMMANGIMYLIFYICVSVVSFIERKMPEFVEYERQTQMLSPECSGTQGANNSSCSEDTSVMSILGLAMRTAARFVIFASKSVKDVMNSDYANKIGIISYDGALSNVHSTKYLIFSLIMLVCGAAVIRRLIKNQTAVKRSRAHTTAAAARSAKAKPPADAKGAVSDEKKTH